MTKIIAVLNQKGGSGKTTLSTNIARQLHLEKERVLLVDSDPQGSARDWHAAADGELLKVVGLDRPTLDKDLEAVKSGYDWIVIDGAPQLQKMAISAIKSADVILIPIQPSPYDIWACSDLVDLIKARQEVADERPQAAFIISRMIKNTILSREIREVIEEYQLPVFLGGTVQRVVYANSASSGKTPMDIDPDSEASKEVRQIVEELKYFIAEKEVFNHESIDYKTNRKEEDIILR